MFVKSLEIAPAPSFLLPTELNSFAPKGLRKASVAVAQSVLVGHKQDPYRHGGCTSGSLASSPPRFGRRRRIPAAQPPSCLRSGR